MTDLPLPDDPVVAILLDRLDRLSKDLAEHRKESKANIEKTEARMTALEIQINKKLEPMTAAFNRAAGGYLVIVGFAGVIAWVSGLGSYIGKLFH